MRLAFLLLILSSLTGCPVTSKKTDALINSYPDPCGSFRLTKKMWKVIGSQAKDQIMGCLNPAYLADGDSSAEEVSPEKASPLKAISAGIVGRLLICPQAPITPVVFGMSLMIMTPVIFLPMDLLSSKPESCYEKKEIDRH